MRALDKKMVDYSQFRFSKLNTPEFSHVKLLLGWVIYFIFYFLTENLIPVSGCHVIYCALDDLIPFNEVFVIIYVLWYFFVFIWLFYYFLYDVKQFRALQIFLILTQVIAMITYMFYPSIQLLRPEVFPRDNVFTWMLSIIYAFDTPTGVCPSLHVGYCLAIFFTVWHDSGMKKGIKVFNGIFTLLVSIAVCFVKQHSAVDVFAGLLMCVLIEICLMIGRSCHGK